MFVSRVRVSALVPWFASEPRRPAGRLALVLLAGAIIAMAGCGPSSDASSGEAVDGAAVEHDGEHDHYRVPPSHHPSDPALAGLSPPQDESTRAMIATLQRIWEDAARRPLPYFHLNNLRADMLARLIERSRSVDPNLRLTYARELLFAGRTEAAIAELEGLADASEAAGGRDTPYILDQIAIAYLRLGEQQNCLTHPAAEACILPLRGDGIHKIRTGSERATELYRRLLDNQPGDLKSRWLLNIAHMTLGEYPDGVPADALIPGLEPRGLTSIPHFPNRAPDLGIDLMGISGSVSVDDFNNDGHLDLFATAYGLNDRVRLFFGDGHGGFEDHTVSAGLSGITGGLNVIHADYDNDGFVDILVLRGAWLDTWGAHPNSLLRNNGDGTFSDVTIPAGVLTLHPTQTAAWVDFNNDGHLDLFIGNETRSVSGQEIAFYGRGGGDGHPCELFMNNGNGTFTEVAARVGLDVKGFVKGAVWGDVNNDGLPDLYLSLLGEPNRLYLNEGGVADLGPGGRVEWSFAEVGARAGVTEPLWSFPVWFWDFDNNGWEDLLVLPYDIQNMERIGADVAREYLGEGTIAEKPRLYRNNGDGTFSNVTAAAGLSRAVLFSMGSNFGDLNNDGFLDFYVGTGSPDFRSLVPNRMFVNDETGRFMDVTFDGGFGHLQKGHGVAFADFDRDGHQDVYAVMGGAFEADVAANVLFGNPGFGSENAWIRLRLEGRQANRSAIGARIQVSVTRPDGTPRQIHRTVTTGGSFGASSMEQVVGLGDAVRIDSVAVRWPNEGWTREVFVDVPLRRDVRIVEGEGAEVL